MNKKGMTPLVALIFGVVVILGIMMLTGNLNLGGGDTLAAGGSGASSSGSGGAVKQAAPSSGVTVTFQSRDRFDSTITPGSTHQYRVKNPSTGQWPSAWTNVNEAGTATIGSNLDFQVVYNTGNNSGSTSTLFYISPPQEYNAGISDQTVSFSQSVRNGSLKLRIFNEEGDLIDSTSTPTVNETIGAGDVLTLRGDLQSEFERGLPYGGCAVLEYTADFDDSGMALSFNGVSQKENVPTHYTLNAAANKAKGYSVPPMLSSLDIVNMVIQLDADDTNNPGVEDDIRLTIFPKDYHLDGDDGQYKLSCEDEDGAALPIADTLTILEVD